MPDTQALVLAGHGSHHDPRSAAPVHAHAGRIHERGCFDTVRAAFWKEQPSLAEVLGTVEAAPIYVVPLMTSEGYFTDRVFPRELGLGDGRVDRQDVRYTAPVGTHERIVDVVLDRVDSVLDDVDHSGVGLALVGHGTERHEQSASATVTQADRLRALDRFAAVEPVFLDQAPAVGDLGELFDVDGVVVVPFFVADGHHVRRDIPDALGLPTRDEPFGGPTPVGEKQVWYTGAVGTAPGLTAVILERAAEAGAGFPGDSGSGSASFSEAERAFLRWLEGGDEISTVAAISGHTRTWGELSISVTATAEGNRRHEIRHLADRDVPTAKLDSLTSPAAVRDQTGTNEIGNHRPLRTAKTLPRGWRAGGLDGEEAIRTVRAVYPASIDHWYREREGTLDVTDFESVIERQAGRYRELDELDSDTLAATIEACCGDCVRRPAWTNDGTADPEPADGAFPCPEPCSFLLEAARSCADTDQPKRPTDDAVDPSVPAAAFNREGNRYRVRFRRARASADRDQENPLPKP